MLGLDPGVSLEEARTRYRELAKKFHPDKGEVSSDRFLAIKEAMTHLEEDQSLLNSSRADYLPDPQSGKDMWVSATAKVEDAIFRDEIRVLTNPKRKCPNCRGTGAIDQQYHVCHICGGKGRVPGEIMRMAMGTNECPGCAGTGVHIPAGKICHLCKGSSLASYTVTKRIPSGPALMSGGKFNFVFPGEGHNGAYGGAPGDLHISLEMEGTAGLEYVGGKAVLWAEITPAMYVTGCTVTVEILGEKIEATMQPMTGRSDVAFKGKKLQVRATLVIPFKLPKDQMAQYKILRELEKKQKISEIKEANNAGTEDTGSRTELPGRAPGFKRHKVRTDPVKQVPPGRKGSKRGPSRR